jgi:two-component system chemotaxis sensor kinase CheA
VDNILADLTPDERRMFWEEAEDLIGEIERIALQELAATGTGDVATVFRAVHTLKGMAAMVGFQEWAAQAHALETCLEQVRQGFDSLKTVAPSLLDLVDNLKRWRDGNSAATMVITVTLAPDTAFPGVRVLQIVESVRELAEVTDVDPPQDTWEAFDGHVVTLTLRSPASVEHLRETLQSIPDVTSVSDPAHQSVSIGSEPSSPETGTVSAVHKKTDSVRVPVEVLDKILEGIGELVVDRTQAQHLAESYLPPGDFKTLHASLNDRMARTTMQLQDLVMRSRMLPLEVLFRQYPRVVHDLSVRLGKSFRLVVEGQDTELDRAVIDSIGEPLLHLIRNACDHGIEPPDVRRAAGKPVEGQITVRAQPLAGHVMIQVADDGGGIDWDALRKKAVEQGWWDTARAETATEEDLTALLFRPGLSTASRVTEVSGRGVGLDVVETVMTALHGSVTVRSTPGQGTSFELVLPLTMAIMRSLLVQVGLHVYAIPLANVERVDTVDFGGHHHLLGNGFIRGPEGLLRPVVDLDQWWYGVVPEQRSAGYLVRIRDGALSFALKVADVLGEEEVVVKTLGLVSSLSPEFTGATVLGDGRLALVLDARRVLQKWQRDRGRTNDHSLEVGPRPEALLPAGGQ